MLTASLHARKEELQIKITHIAEPSFSDPFFILGMRTKTSGAFSAYLELHQLYQIANTLNTFLAQHNANTTTQENNNADAS